LNRQVKQAGDKLARLVSHQSQRVQANDIKKVKFDATLELQTKQFVEASEHNKEANAEIESLLDSVINS
jgi:hypothetical protein